MTRLTIKYFSTCLFRETTLEMLIPTGKKPAGNMKTLILLHGYSGAGGNWVPEYLAEKYNFAICCPTGENGFWLNGLSTGHSFQSMLGEELIDFLRLTFGLARSREDTYIMGMSMGGFGAMHTALAYPDRIGKAACLSSAYIIHSIAGLKPTDPFVDNMCNYEYYRECFGDLDRLVESENNPEVLLRKNRDSGIKNPEIIMCCGTEDFLLERNREFHKFMVDNGFEHTYFEDSGNHNMEYWDKCVPIVIPMMFDEGKNCLIRSASAEEMKSLYDNLVVPNFPENEVKPLSSIERMMADGCYRAFVAYLNEKAVGCALITDYPGGNILLLDYLAVDNDYRSMGIGGRLIKGLSELVTDKVIVIETETISSAANQYEVGQRMKRNAFYSGHGARMKELVTKIFGAEYNIWTLGEDGNINLKEEYTKLYKYMVQNETLYNDNVIIG